MKMFLNILLGLSEDISVLNYFLVQNYIPLLENLT